MTSLKPSTLARLFCLLGFFAATQSHALDLITPAEAQLPSAYQEGKRAGLTRGPGIDVASPSGVVQKNAPAPGAVRRAAAWRSIRRRCAWST